jgi:Rho termination factor, N-terminal domain
MAASTSRGSSKRDLYERAKKLGIEGRSDMTKEQLADAIARKQG